MKESRFPLVWVVPLMAYWIYWAVTIGYTPSSFDKYRSNWYHFREIIFAHNAINKRYICPNNVIDFSLYTVLLSPSFSSSSFRSLIETYEQYFLWKRIQCYTTIRFDHKITMYNLCFSTEHRILKCTDIIIVENDPWINHYFWDFSRLNIEISNDWIIHPRSIYNEILFRVSVLDFQVLHLSFRMFILLCWHFTFLIPTTNAYYRKILRFCCKLDNGNLIRTRKTTRYIWQKKKKRKIAWSMDAGS